jgi:alpha-1,3-rhamnosyl/mannosyltransferase
VRKLVVTPEAADSSFRPVDDRSLLDTVKARYSLPPSFVLAVGARRPHKNFALLVKAAGATRSKATLLFVGEADERFPDEAAEAAKGMGDRVRFLGNVPEAELPAIYSLATVFACPSTVEGFGLPVLEAMACGAPVVCSDIPVLREVAGDAALLAGPRDIPAWAAALDRVLSSEDEQERLGQAGHARAALFNWRNAAVAVLHTYRQLGYAE